MEQEHDIIFDLYPINVMEPDAVPLTPEGIKMDMKIEFSYPENKNTLGDSKGVEDTSTPRVEQPDN